MCPVITDQSADASKTKMFKKINSAFFFRVDNLNAVSRGCLRL